MPTALKRAGQALRGTVGGNGTIMGLALQVLGAFVLMFALGVENGFLPLLSLGAVLFGEVIFISSLTHRGVRSRGERIK